MSIKLEGKLTKPFSTELVHESGAIIQTTAPKDNGGEGNLFSPTDLFAVSLGSCMLTVMSLYAEKHNISLQQAEFVLEKEMETTPRKIKKIVITFKIKTSASEETFQTLLKVAKSCPVAASLHPDIELVENFERI